MITQRVLIHFLSSFLSSSAYFAAKGCSKSCWAEDRVPPSGLRQIETKSLNSTEKESGSLGDGFYVTWARRSQKPASGVGHLPTAHSIKMIPRLHRSVSLKYWEPERRSGDMYDIVPTQDVRQSMLVSVWPLTPKSASLTTPFLFSRMFAGFMSLCTTCFSLCK